MGVLDFLKGPNINEGLEKYRQYKYAVLVDLRSEKDFSKGRIPGSICAIWRWCIFRCRQCAVSES